MQFLEFFEIKFVYQLSFTARDEYVGTVESKMSNLRRLIQRDWINDREYRIKYLINTPVTLRPSADAARSTANYTYNVKQ